jgi:threonine dehydratase
MAEETSMPSFDDVASAAERLKGIAHRTPVMTSRTLDAAVGATVFLKCESFQRAGAFKFRGAYNAISRLSEAEKRRGVLAYSSGNHAQAVALACRLLGARATVVMPRDAPAPKRLGTEAYGAEIVAYDPAGASREEIAGKIQEETGAVLIPPFDHPDVVAGQGTSALELFEEVGALDALFVPCGGGGLLSGCALAAKHLSSGCRVVGVEPELADDATRSFRTGILHTVRNPPTIADGARTPSLGKITFALVRELVDDMVTVSEAEIVEATLFLWERMKLVVEPTGALGLAAVRRGSLEMQGKRLGLILSGGNVDPSLLAALRSVR